MGLGGARPFTVGRRAISIWGFSMSLTYLLDKLDAAEISTDPFPHVYIENFLEDSDFKAVVSSPEISLRPAATIQELFSELDSADYKAIEFPGCTKSRAEYVAWVENKVK